MERQEALSRVLHGVRNHADLHNPITFEVDYPSAGQFIVDVERAAPEGATLDRHPCDGASRPWSQDFPRTAPDQHRHPAHRGGRAEATRWRCRPGAHHHHREHRRGLALRHVPPDELPRGAQRPRAPTLANPRGALVWVQNRDHTWSHVRKGSVTPAQAAEVSLGGLAQGDYQIEQWDTFHGPPRPARRHPLHRWTRGDRDSSGPGERRGLQGAGGSLRDRGLGAAPGRREGAPFAGHHGGERRHDSRPLSRRAEPGRGRARRALGQAGVQDGGRLADRGLSGRALLRRWGAAEPHLVLQHPAQHVLLQPRRRDLAAGLGRLPDGQLALRQPRRGVCGAGRERGDDDHGQSHRVEPWRRPGLASREQLQPHGQLLRPLRRPRHHAARERGRGLHAASP